MLELSGRPTAMRQIWIQLFYRELFLRIIHLAVYLLFMIYVSVLRSPQVHHEKADSFATPRFNVHIHAT